MRLQHFLALAGVASRRRSEQLITAGNVSVNGEIMQKLGTKIDPERDIIEVNGRRVEIEKKMYVLLNKPRGCLSSVADQRGRPTVGDLLSALPSRMYPVGRLDRDTEGVLLMTNDGEICHRLTHPRFGVEKTYHAKVKGRPSRSTIGKLKNGVDIGEMITSPAKVRLLGVQKDCSLLEIIIHEGRKRQIKRMCKAVGHRVIELTRIDFGGFKAGSLKPGEYRLLNDQEVAKLKRKISRLPE